MLMQDTDTLGAAASHCQSAWNSLPTASLITFPPSETGGAPSRLAPQA